MSSKSLNVFFSLIRLEFEDSTQDYYSELDAVLVSGYEHNVIEKQVGKNLRILSELFKKHLEDERDEEHELDRMIDFDVKTENTIKTTLTDMPVKVNFLQIFTKYISRLRSFLARNISFDIKKS